VWPEAGFGAGRVSAPSSGTTAEIPSYWFSENAVKPPDGVLSLPSASDVVVVGGGVLGVAATYWLVRLGFGVVLLEAAQLGCGASGRNAGFMLCGSSALEDPAFIRAVLDNESIDAEFLEPGHLALASSREIEERIVEEIAKRPSSAPSLQWLNHGQCEDLLGIRISDQFLGGRWFPSGRSIHPARFVYGLANAATRHGAVLAFNTPALSLVSSGARSDSIQVITSRGRVNARHVVLACNVKTGDFLPELQHVLAPLRGQVVCTTKLHPIFRIGLAVDWGTLYWRQTGDGTIVLGGYHNLDPLAEATAREGLNPKIQSALLRFLPDAFPGFPEVTVQQRWSGIMDETADGKPIVGPWLDGRNIWVIAGCGGHGLPPALGLGKALAESIAQGQPSAVLSALDPARFKDRIRDRACQRSRLGPREPKN
jgi:gamma-glutamylputrescine oxidase